MRPIAMLGLILIIAGVISVVLSESVAREAGSVYLFKDMSRGQDMANEASAMRYGGFAIGAIGLVLLGVGLVRRPQGSGGSRYPQAPPFPRAPHPIRQTYCVTCGSAIPHEASFCTGCGAELTKLPRHPFSETSSSGSALYCMTCGSAIPHEANFCTGCGAPAKKAIL